MKHFDLESGNSQLLLVDFQEKLLPAVCDDSRKTRNVRILLKACDTLQIPVKYTEHYPQGLGKTVPEILEGMPEEKRRFEKVHFSCCDDPDFETFIRFAGRDHVILAGIESHICVLQTAADLLSKEYKVFIASDACSSRENEHHAEAMQCLRSLGAFVAPTESIAYRLLRKAGTSAFKAMLPFFK
ncbi:MAG: isochorismatase family protein [Thermovirgaceae bacterium]